MRDIPNYLDDPQQILFWEFDEFILLAIMFGIGHHGELSRHHAGDRTDWHQVSTAKSRIGKPMAS